MTKKESPLKGQKAFKKAEPYVNISYTLIGAMGLFGYLGHWLDKKLQVHPYLLLLGIFVGLFFGYYNMIKVIRSLDKK
jgi:F0F1-type ATP synthase assembly protein I